jgi:Cu/Ag efflux protein CusF
MFNIALYLKKFENLGLGERLLKEAIRTSVKEVMKFDLDAKDISLKNGEVTFKVSPAMKNAIYMKKATILKRMEENGVENVGDIR